MRGTINCEECSNYDYDEETGYYSCLMAFDEDDMARAIQGRLNSCPYFQFNDEYTLARKQ